MADEEHKFFASVISCFLQPMCNFLEGDSKTIQRERKKLESKRLDLDVCKNKVKKAKSSQAKEEVNSYYNACIFSTRLSNILWVLGPKMNAKERFCVVLYHVCRKPHESSFTKDLL